jgi:cardiolipin synthase
MRRRRLNNRVVLLVPGEPEEYLSVWRQRPERRAFFEQLEALGRYDNFTLVGIAGATPDGGRQYVYVHAKIMIVDDAWAMIVQPACEFPVRP